MNSVRNRVIILLSISTLFFLMVIAPVLAKDSNEDGVTMKPSASVSAVATPSAEEKKVEYALPYSGLLPDNPLYRLKTFRDFIINILISDPLKKAQFGLLQADKRLSAGVALAKKNKHELAVSTISKGQNYFEQAIVSTGAAGKEGKSIAPMKDKLFQAVRKHEEVLRNLVGKAPKQFTSSYTSLYQRIEDLQEKVVAVTQ